MRIENRRAVEEFIGNVTVLPFTIRGAAHFAQLRAELTRTGLVCGPYDMLIAGHARSEDLTVVTNNLGEFGRIPGLMVENWL
jgi:tRNA(fMet)-specific endonuclease VapC